MPQFRWPELQHDLSLAKEVASRRPSKPADWEVIAETLSADFSIKDKPPVELKGRGCRERLERLLDKFKAEDSKSLKRSGTEEEYDELTQLLEDIFTYRRDVLVALSKEKEEKKKKELCEKKQAEDMRESAMETLSQRKRLNNSSADSSVVSLDSDGEDDDAKGKGKKRKRASKLSAIELLEEKFERRSELKEKELDLRRAELELQRRKLEVDEEVRKANAALMEKKSEMEMEERRAMLELLRKLISQQK